ncbi:MAG: tRNA lysidine(34) synthetase TilS, partial [Flavobacteriaceae bacterium]|nr:tRNA lysidine(34) synthetase TilS [Flavobacteriaceae bacterium]
NNLSWREDKSNAQTKYLRNKIRHDIIPVLKSLNPNFMESFSKTLENLQGSKQLVEDRIDEIQSQLIQKDGALLKFNIQKLKSLNNPKAYLFELLNSYGFTEWDDVLSLLNAQSGKQVFSKTHYLLKDREFLLLTELNSKNDEKKEYKISDKDQSIELANLKIKFTHQKIKNLPQQQTNPKYTNNNLIYLDKDKLIFPLTVRKWKNGDYFYPMGMQGKKKLSKYFKDEKFSLLDKENIWLLCSNNNIAWIIGKRLDNRFEINKNTTEILKIEI